jgi:hypothetical protein
MRCRSRIDVRFGSLSRHSGLFLPSCHVRQTMTFSVRSTQWSKQLTSVGEKKKTVLWIHIEPRALLSITTDITQFVKIITKNSICVRCQVLMATNMKIIVFCDVAPCSLVEIDRRFRGAYCLHQGPNYGGRKHLWNVGQFLPDNSASFQETVIFSPREAATFEECSEHISSPIPGISSNELKCEKLRILG